MHDRGISSWTPLVSLLFLKNGWACWWPGQWSWISRAQEGASRVKGTRGGDSECDHPTCAFLWLDAVLSLVRSPSHRPWGQGDALSSPSLSGRVATKEEDVEEERSRIWLWGGSFWRDVSERHSNSFLIELFFALVLYVLFDFSVFWCFFFFWFKLLSFLKPCI